jgi:hypothetical protein
MEPRYSNFPTLTVFNAIQSETIGQELIVNAAIEGTLPADSTEGPLFAPGALLSQVNTGDVFQNTSVTSTYVWEPLESAAPVTGIQNVAVIPSVTTDGGAAAEVFTVTGALAGDDVIAVLYDGGTNTVTITDAPVAGTDTVTVTFSADPGNDAILALYVTREI